jgi:hypothetical protein
MPAPAIYFETPYDIHLLRGQSFQIVNATNAFATLLRIGGDFAHDYVDSHPDISYTFWTSFDEDKANDFGITVENPVEHDHAFDRKPDWLITLDENEPAAAQNQVRNFYLYAEVENAADNSSNWTALRIHIHTRIEEVWITPAGLTITPGVTHQARLHGRFDDDVIAEIGNQRYRNALFNIDPPLDISWNSPTPTLVDPANGSIRAQTITGIHDLNVSVAYDGVTQTAASLIMVSGNLAANSPIQAELVATGGCPGFPRLNEVPNVLFLSEGFTLEQEFNFKILVADYVKDLMSNKITAPFNLLRGSINFWMIFIPSRESGATYLGDLAVRRKPNEPILPRLTGRPIPFIERDQIKPVDDWGVEHLLYWVGLPVRAERDTNDQTVIDNLFTKWEATTHLTEEEIEKLKTNKSLIKSWQRLGERRLPPVKDTAFGVTIQDTTAARRENDFSDIGLDPKRIQRGDLDTFFSTLRDDENNLIGPTFVQQASSTQPQGKDWDNIVVLSAIRRGRAVNSTGYMFSVVEKASYSDAKEILIGDLATLRVPIAPTDLPDKLPIKSKNTTTHELCHSFGLDDEYGEKPPLESYKNKPVDDPMVSGWSFAKYTKAASSVDWSSNVQARADLEVPVSSGGTQIQPYRIKWRYHRIQKCGVVTTITVTGNHIELTLQNGQAAQFTANKPVFLRKRRRNTTVYFIHSRATGQDRLIASIVTPNPLPAAFVNAVDITAIDVVDDRVTLRRGTDTLIVQVDRGQAASLQTGTGFTIRSENRYGPVLTLFRTAGAVPNGPDIITKAISAELTVVSTDPANNTLTLTSPANATLPDYMRTLDVNEAIIVYEPIAMPEGQRSADYPYAEIIAQKVLNHLLVNPFAFNTDDQHREVIDRTPDNTNIPGHLVPCCSKRDKEIIGLYSGGDLHHGGVYHPAAKCMMRQQVDDDHYTELCAVCRYTLINQIDPTKHGDFDADYMKRKIYPD